MDLFATSSQQRPDDTASCFGAPTEINFQMRKPFKVCDASRKRKKGVMAGSFEELSGVIKRKYEINGEFMVVLEEDDTEIDEDEYFQTLPENTLLKFIPVENTANQSTNTDIAAERRDVGTTAKVAMNSQESNTEVPTKRDLGITAKCSTLDQATSTDCVTWRDRGTSVKAITNSQGTSTNIVTTSSISGSETNTEGVHRRNAPTSPNNDKEPFQIFARIPNGSTITVWVKAGDIVATVKERIERKVNINPEEQRLIFAGKQLEDARPISDYNIRAANTLHLVFRLCSIQFRIFVLFPNGDRIEVGINAVETVRQVKAKIENETGIHAVHLLFADTLLKNWRPIADYSGIRSMSTLHAYAANDSFPIRVGGPGGFEILLNVRATDTVAEVKEVIAKQTGIAAAEQRLTFNGKHLCGAYTIWDYNSIRPMVTLRVTHKTNV